MPKYIQIGVIALRTAVGEPLKTQPVYTELTPELEAQHQMAEGDGISLLADKYKEYLEAKKRHEASRLIDVT